MKKITSILFLLFTSISLAKTGFIKNMGQMPEDVKYYAQLKGVNYFVKSDGVYLDFYNAHTIKEYPRVFKIGQVVKMDIQGLEEFYSKEKKVISRNNYFKGKKEDWISNVPVYEEIVLENVIDNIDLRVYIDKEVPRYDFLVHPGADISKLAYNFSGTKSFEVSDTEVTFETEYATLTTSKLLAYQVDGKLKKTVECSFVQNGNKISFEASNYDKNKTLVIDPIVFSSYYGTEADDNINDMFLLEEGEMIITGGTRSASFPVTDGVYQGFFNFETDAYISKLKIRGDEKETIFSTYLGGSLDDEATQIKISVDNSIIVTGHTSSNNFPLEKPLQILPGGGKDIFVTKLSEDGTFLFASTYIGGGVDDIPHTMDLGSQGSIYIAGQTNSDNFPLQSALQPTKEGFLNDGFILNLNRDVTNLTYSSYYGGDGDDIIYGIRTDQGGNLYFCGSTTSSNLPMAPGGFTGRPFDDTYNGKKDMFLGKFLDGGAFLELSTYYGGLGDDEAFDVELFGTNGFYIVGSSDSDPVGFSEDGLIITNNSYETKPQGKLDIVFAKFSEEIDKGFADGQDILFSTYIGGSEDDIPSSLSVNNETNQLIISGYTESFNFPIESENDSEYNNGRDGFTLYINQDASNITYSEFFGGSGDDENILSLLDSESNLWFAGNTTSDDIPLTAEPFLSKNTSKSAYLGKNVFGDLELLTPNNGGTFCRNLILNINWFVSGTVEDTGYKVIIRNIEDDEVYPIDLDFEGEKPIRWVVPNDVPLGNYIVEIIHPNNLKAVSSEPFTISSPPIISDFSIANGSARACLGDEIKLVVATEVDDEEYEYVWLKDGQEIDTETTIEYSRTITDKSDSGEYTVEIEGQCAPFAESGKIEITVLDDTEVTVQSDLSMKVLDGNSINLFVEAEGSELEYQWFFNGNELLGQTNSSLSIESASNADEGAYYCRIEGQCGETVQSDEIVLTVEPNSVKITQDDKDFYFDYVHTKQSSLDYAIFSNKNVEAELSIFDALGNKVLTENIRLKNNINQSSINTSNFANGLYILSISQNGKLISSKFVINE